MTYFLMAIIGALVGFAACAVLANRRVRDVANSASADRLARHKLDKANGVLRRELFELRAQYEPSRNHGFGRSHG